MAPALMEANATVSQNQDRKFKFINSKILDNISNLASSREIIDKDIATDYTVKSKLTTNSSRTKQSTDNCTKNQISDKETSIDFDNNSKEVMDDQSSDAIVPSSPKFEKQCRENLERNAFATCALKETDGAKAKLVKSQTQSEFSTDAVVKEKFLKNKTKLQSLDHRARSIREKIRDFQTNRLITHVKKQAQLMDYTLRISNDLRQKNETETIKSSLNSTDKQNFTKKQMRTLVSPNPVRQPSQIVNIVKTNDSPMSTCRQSQQISCGGPSSMPTPHKEIKFDDVSLESKKQTFGILAAQIEEITHLNDPDITDPESDCDDDVEVPCTMVTNQKHAPKLTKKRVDEVWLRDRVKIGSMCTWIQAQIADLSHKIKKYGDFYQQVKSSRKLLVLEEIKHPIAIPVESQQHPDNDCLGKNDLNGESVQNNIFEKLQTHKNGLSKDLTGQSRNEIKYEKVSGARTLPIKQLPKHQYVKRKIKMGAESSHCPYLPTPFPCKQCQKASSMVSGRTTGNLAAVYLDHNYHEQLSAKYDIKLPHCLESTVRKGKIYSGRKGLVPASLSEKLPPDPKDMTKNKHSMSKLASNAAAATNVSKMRLDRKRQKRMSKNKDEDSDLEESPIPKRKAAALSAASQLQKRASSLRAPSSGSGESRPSTPIIDNHSLSSSYPSPSLSQLVKKKNRTSSEYDINNIVIPYSISSSTRLEKPQYKEILTPGWRPLTSDSQNDENSRDEFEEDTSDMAYGQRHSNCEVSEHKRFTSYFQLPLRRSRSSRKSSECNTPEPYSPQHPDHSNSAIATTPTEFILATPSFGKINKLNSFSALPLQQEEYKVMGWPKRTFPLSGYDIEVLSNPDKAKTIEKADIPSPENNLPEIDSRVNTSPDSDLISPTTENSPNGEADDKWTVRLVTEEKQSSVEDIGNSRKGIVLKLAKK